ncbi:hypothetical protein RUM44_003514 [Polyplax serrata]|uniref:Uncharacterized protein n=1 Tax=Polyplax serrata TaxID=468196 RepID=A0ABR1AH93_POLSC
MSGATTLPANRTDFIQRGAIKTSGEFAAKEISREKLDKKIEWNGAPLDAQQGLTKGLSMEEQNGLTASEADSKDIGSAEFWQKKKKTSDTGGTHGGSLRLPIPSGRQSRHE